MTQRIDPLLKPASILIEQVGNRIIARKGSRIVESDTSGELESVVEASMTHLTSGRTWQETIRIIGDYEIGGQIDVVSNTRLELDGRIKIADQTPFATAKILYFDNVSNCSVYGGVWDSNGSNHDGVDAQGFGAMAIETTSGTRDITWENMSVLNAGRDAFLPNNSSYIRILNCTASGALDDGFNPLNSSHVQIIGCHAIDCVNDGLHLSVGSTDVVCSNSISENSGTNGLAILGNRVTVVGCDIEGRVFTNANDTGDFIISNCNIHGNDFVSLIGPNIIFTDNTVVGRITTTSDTDNLYYTNNHVDSSGIGQSSIILASGDGDIVLQGGSVSGAGTSFYAIQVNRSGVRIKDMHLISEGNFGVFIDGVDDVHVEGCTINATGASFDAINLNNADRTVLIDNVCDGNRRGIDIGPNCDNTVAHRNICSGNTTANEFWSDNITTNVGPTISTQSLEDGGNLTVGDGADTLVIPPQLDGYYIFKTYIHVGVAGTNGTTDFQVARVRDGSAVDVFSTKPTIGSGELSTATAATEQVVNQTNREVQTDDVLRLDVDVADSPPASGPLHWQVMLRRP